MYKKPLLLSIATLSLCLLLLAGAFLIVPKVTQASAPNTPIFVSQPSQCTPLQADANGMSTNYQMCVVTVSIKKDYSKGVHFGISYSGKDCSYNGCSTSSSMSGIAVAMPESNSITLSAYPIHVMLITPYYQQHGYLTMTFTFNGPSNKVSVQLVAQNNMG